MSNSSSSQLSPEELLIQQQHQVGLLTQQTNAQQNVIDQLQQAVRALENKNTGSTVTATRIKINKPNLFCGLKAERIDPWLFAMNEFLVLSGITSPLQQVQIAASYLKDNALSWWMVRSGSASGSGEPINTFRYFESEIRAYFKPVNSRQIARDQLHNLQQRGSVSAYIFQCQSLWLEVDDMSESEKMDKFKRGLKSIVREKLEIEGATSLEEMMLIAQRVDAIYYRNSVQRVQQRNYNNNYNNYNRFNENAMDLSNIEDTNEDVSNSDSNGGNGEESNVNAVQVNNRGPLVQNVTAEEVRRCRQLRLCIQCKKPGHIARFCSQLNNNVNNGRNLKFRAQ